MTKQPPNPNQLKWIEEKFGHLKPAIKDNAAKEKVRLLDRALQACSIFQQRTCQTMQDILDGKWTYPSPQQARRESLEEAASIPVNTSSFVSSAIEAYQEKIRALIDKVQG